MFHGYRRKRGADGLLVGDWGTVGLGDWGLGDWGLGTGKLQPGRIARWIGRFCYSALYSDFSAWRWGRSALMGCAADWGDCAENDAPDSVRNRSAEKIKMYHTLALLITGLVMARTDGWLFHLAR